MKNVKNCSKSLIIQLLGKWRISSRCNKSFGKKIEMKKHIESFHNTIPFGVNNIRRLNPISKAVTMGHFVHKIEGIQLNKSL